MINKTRAVILDTETHSKDAPIPIEIAWLDPITKESFCERYNPLVPIALGALSVHHILDEELVDCPPCTDFKLPDDVGYIIGHNIKFDWEALGQPDVKQICTLALSRKYLPDLDSYSQSALTYYYFRREAKALLKESHSAMADVMNLYKLCQCGIWPKCKSWEDLYLLSEQAKIPTHWTFGKHKGKLLSDAPKDYREWYLKLPVHEQDSYLVRALKELK